MPWLKFVVWGRVSGAPGVMHICVVCQCSKQKQWRRRLQDNCSQSITVNSLTQYAEIALQTITECQTWLLLLSTLRLDFFPLLSTTLLPFLYNHLGQISAQNKRNKHKGRIGQTLVKIKQFWMKFEIELIQTMQLRLLHNLCNPRGKQKHS